MTGTDVDVAAGGGTDSVAPRRRRRRWPVVLGTVLGVLVVAWFGAAWYFTDVFYDDALRVEPPPVTPEPDSEVVAVDAATITLEPRDDDDAELRAPGTWGLWWDGGYGVLTDVVDADDDAVTRAFDVVAGTAPPPGTPADVDKYVFGDDPDDVLGLTWEPVAIETELGPMAAWWVPAPEGAAASDVPETWAILVHGKGSGPDEMLRMLEPVHAAGLSALVVTYRGDRDRPTDPSGVYRYGETEWADLDAAVAYAVDQGAQRLVLGGASTGAALIGAWLDRGEHTEATAAVVLDSANADPGRTFEHVAAQRTVPGTSVPLPPGLAWTAFRLAELRFPLDLAAADVSDTLATLDVPVLLVHGTGDPRVPVEASRDLVAEREAAGLPTAYLETDAGPHVGSYNDDPDAYRDAVAQLLDEALGVSDADA